MGPVIPLEFKSGTPGASSQFKNGAPGQSLKVGSHLIGFFLIRKKLLYNTKNVREVSSIANFMILALRICDAAPLKYDKKNFNSDIPYWSFTK